MLVKLYKKMRILGLILFLNGAIANHSFAQRFTINDLETIVNYQDQNISLGAKAYYFITGKIPVYSISGGAIENNGSNKPTTESFMNKKTREILRTTITNINLKKKIIGIEIRYAAPASTIEKLKAGLKENGYKFKKRKKYYIKKKPKRERNIITNSKHQIFVSDFDDQQEIMLYTEKKLN